MDFYQDIPNIPKYTNITYYSLIFYAYTLTGSLRRHHRFYMGHRFHRHRSDLCPTNKATIRMTPRNTTTSLALSWLISLSQIIALAARLRAIQALISRAPCGGIWTNSGLPVSGLILTNSHRSIRISSSSFLLITEQ